MDFLIELYKRLRESGETPQRYGSYHLIWIGIVIVVSILLIRLFHNCPEGVARGIVLVFWLSIVVLEILKQFSLSCTLKDGELIFNYNWHIFPYQFCSTPLYILPFIVFCKDGKLRDAAILFTVCFASVGGLTVYIFPESVFSSIQFINFQTMFHHGSQLFLAAFLGVRYREKITLSSFLRGGVVFLFLAFLALVLNIASVETFPLLGIDGKINFFYLSPYERYLPVVLRNYGLEDASYPTILFGYIFAVFLAGSIIAFLTKAISLITVKD